MSTTGSTSSFTDSSGISVLGDSLQIPNYHFKGAPISSLTHGENVDIIFGYRISNKKPVIAKISSNSLRLEREYYIMKRLYQLGEGTSFIVRPLEYINLPSGLAVVIYADEGQNYLEYRRQPDEGKNSGSDRASVSSETTVGYNISERRRRKRQSGCDNFIMSCSGPAFDLCTFLRFAIKCTDCLEFVHRNNTIHGEIKLSAFQWTGEDSDRVKIWNFSPGSKSLENYLTSEGWRKTANNKETMDMLHNILIYMSPEQTGRMTYIPDHRSDIYSLGVVFYVLLTGRNPFDGGPLEILNSILSKKIPLIHEVQIEIPEVVSRIIERMTHQSPDNRYCSASGIRSDLKECLRRIRSSTDNSQEIIELFPLAEHDVASVFTLPKIIYGRQDIISEMTCIIERTSGIYRQIRSKKEKSYTSSVRATISDVQNSNASGSDYCFSDSHSINEVTSFPDRKSPISSSFYSGLDGSDGSSSMSGVGQNLDKQGAEIVCLAGPGGVGKSTLFKSVQKTARQHGYVASTKFDSRHKLPYSSILKAMSQILQQVLSESEEEIHGFYTHLKSHLGAQFYNIEALANLVPELKPLLDSSDDKQCERPIHEIHLDNVETQMRFHSLFTEVFRALAQWRMITLFLDDLHLADDASIELIESMIGSRLKILLFIAFREQEVTEQIERMLNNNYANFHTLTVDTLSFESVVDYIGDALHRLHDVDRESILPLAEIIYQKTRGNAFYTKQMIITLEKKKYIFFNWEENEWDYNLAEIQNVINTKDGSDPNEELNIEFLITRLRELPADGQRILKWASFVGDTFSWNTVKYLMVNSEPESEYSDTESTPSHSTSSSQNSDIINEINNDSTHPMVRFSKLYSSRSQNSTTHNKGSRRSSGNTTRSRDPINGLQAALQEGYILPLESDEFKWSHDRYLEAAMGLADPKTRERIHFNIVQYLLQGKLKGKSDCQLLADHISKCLRIVLELSDKKEYLNVLCEAGNKARSSGAHKMGLVYFKSAIQLLDKNAWDPVNYGRTYSLYTNAVSLSWVVGDYEVTEQILDIIFENTQDPIDRMAAHRIQHKYLFSKQMHDEGSDALRCCLKELDFKDYIPKNNKEELDVEYHKIKSMLDKVGLENISSIGPSTDVRVNSIMIILEEMCLVSYWLGNKLEMYYAACKMAELTLTYGLASVSGISLVLVGLAAAELYDQYSFGEELGSTGVSLCETEGSNTEKGHCQFVYATFLLMWKHHFKETIGWYRSSRRLSLSSGDRIYASLSFIYIANSTFFCSSTLTDTLIEAEACYDETYNWSPSSNSNILIMGIIRTCKALQGQTYYNNPEEIFDGDDGFNDKHFVSESCKQSPSMNVTLNFYDSYRMLPLVLYGHYEYAISMGYHCIRNMHYHPSHRHTRLVCMLQSLAIIEKLRSEKLDEKALNFYKENIETNQAYIYTWVENSRINYITWYTLVEAERTSLTSDIAKTCRLYEDAINYAREGDWYLDLCICHEYAGAFYDRVGMKNVAYGLIKKASSLYLSHGSYGKVHQLASKYNTLFDEFDDTRVESYDTGIQTDPLPYTNTQNTWSISSMANINTINDPYVSETIPPLTTEQTLLTLDILDMASILKSSQVMSSEVKFDGLLKSMMTIVLENSGADCGAVIVKDEKYGMCAYGSQQDGPMTFDPPKQLSDEDPLISSRIIHHTINTGESIFINNVEQDARFAVGEWYERSKNKSVICMPIIHKAALVGCLMIEGATGIFTQRHVTVLSLLCQQMGISITNAFLFKSVQRVTMANMRMIEMQKKALEEARKSKEAAVRATRLREIFLANMSHEIRTPFSGFYGMISLLSETDLDIEQRDLVKTAKESCEILLQIIDDLLNFSKLQAGKVILDISPVVVEDIIADVIEMLIAMAIQKNINIDYHVAENVPSVVMADGNRLRQVIINLLGNAIKFTHEGEIHILCSLDTKTPVKDGGDNINLLFEVTDTGIGISQEQRTVLFEPFSQVDGSTTRKYGGTGLGLSICLQLVQLMSGAINVTSTPGKGSNFYFSVQVSEICNQMSRSLLREGLEENNILLRDIKDIRVLSITKHAATTNMVRNLLPGIHVDGTLNIDEFQQMVTQGSYDVIVVGLFMDPDITGTSSSWLEEASKVNPDGLIILMSYPASGFNRKSKWVVPVSSQQLSCKAVRMAVPLRRIKLLRTIGEMLDNVVSTVYKKTTNVNPKSQLITNEEKELFSSLNILIAEDNPVAQKLLLKQLTRLGFKVECANNGLEAINAWSSHPVGYFTMAFFDHHMPKCDGVAATKRIREIERDEKRLSEFPIVALTADVQESARQICMTAGMNGYLTKPLNQKVLAEALRCYCYLPLKGAISAVN